MKSKSDMTMMLVFQKMKAAPTDWPSAYSQQMALIFTLDQKIGMGGITHEPFDLTDALNKYGHEGWEATGITLLMIPPDASQLQSIGMGSTISSYYQVNMIWKSATPRRFLRLVTDLKLAIGMGGVSIDGSIIPDVKKAAASGWSFVGNVQMPVKQSGMTQKMPVQLYFQAEHFDTPPQVVTMA